MLPRVPIFRLREKSLARAVVLSVGAFAVSLRVAGFPYIDRLHGSHWQIVVLVAACWGMGETFRCLDRRWSLYHVGVLILLYSDLMILTLIGVLVVYP